MTTWYNNGFGTSVDNNGGGPTWINNAPAVQAQPQYAQPEFDYATMFNQGRSPTLVPPQYASQYIEAPRAAPQSMLPPARAFDYGQSGVSGNGKISTRDDAAIMEQLMNAQYQEALRNRNMGNPGMGDWQINNIKNEADRYAGIRATGQGTSFFSMPEFATPYDKYNEVARLDTSRTSDLDSIMSGVLGNDYQSTVGYNDGRRWLGLQQLSPVGSSFGGGNFAESVGGYDTGPQVAPPSNGMNATMFRNYNNGNLSSAHDYGSYRNALLRSGANDQSAVARFASDPLQMGGLSVRTGDQSRNWQDITNAPYGSRVGTDGRLYNPNDVLSKYDPDSSNYQPPSFVQPGGMLPFGLDDAFPVSLESTLKNAYDGFNIVDEANPANLLPKNMALNTLKDAAMQMMTNRNMWRGDGGFNSIGNVMAQPWANRNAAPLSYGSIMQLFL